MSQRHYWFGRRHLGNLLVPITWQAFVLIGVQILIVAGGVLAVLHAGSTWATVGWLALCCLALLATFVVAIAKSPMPRWLMTGHDD